MSDSVQGGSLGFHSDMAVMFEHLPADVARNCHDRLLARLPFGQLGDAGMPEVMEAQTGERVFQAANFGLAFRVAA